MMSVSEHQFENDNQNSDDTSQSSNQSQDSEVSDSDSISREWVNPKEAGKNQAEEGVLPQIVGWRRVRRGDGEAIKKLQDLTGVVADSLYPKRSIDDLIERCYFSIVQYDSKGNLVSFTAFDCYPNMPATPFWNDWLSTNYKMNEINGGNVLFIHYMVWKPEHEDIFLPLLLETSFAEFILLKYIVIIKPPKANVPHFYNNSFFPVLPIGLEELENSSIQLLLICLRSSIIRPLCIRIPIDHEYEDIMSIIEKVKKPKRENDLFWDLVNLVYSKSYKSLMCELKGEIAGLMILNLKIDLDLLNEGFELAPFDGLKKPPFESEEDIESEVFEFPENSSVREYPSTNVMMPSTLLFAPMNWEMSFSKLKVKESTTSQNGSSVSSASQYPSQFSFVTLSSIVDLQPGSGLTKVLSQKKSQMFSKTGDPTPNLLIQTPGTTMTHFYPPKYHGQSNAFLIDVFAIDCSKIDEKQSSFDFLEAAFKIVPDRDYCILLTPTDSLPCSLLDLFVRVTPRPLTSFKQELYLCHKNSLSIISMSVRRAVKDDLVAIKGFLNFVDEGDTVYHDILTNCFGENNDFESFVLILEESIVGVSLINSRDNVESFHMYFELADFACTGLRGVKNSSVIKHLVISPKYCNHARFFVRDIMRQVDVSCLYYANITSWKRQCSLVTVLREFTPVKPKRKAGSHGLFPILEEEYLMKPFGLYILSPGLCSFPKIHKNIVIVVVGASRTALSFFENLIFGPESTLYNYNNLICVSPHGLEVDDDGDHIPSLMFPINDNFSRSYLSMLSLETHVSFIHGVMTGINRSEKYIVVNNKSMIKYDYLVLTCGQQYLKPVPAALVPKCQKQETCRNNFRSSLSRFLRRPPETKSHNPPRHLNNMFIINTLKDAQNALHALQFLMKKMKKEGRKIIVYGHDLHVFLTINTLLKLGIPGEIIVFVEPFPSGTTTVTLFNDYCVDQAVLDEVKGCKVSYYNEYFLYDWSVSSEDYITSIIFHSKHKRLVIPCLAFFPFLEKLVSDVTFKACNDAGLVYDGRLVINHNFRTNDDYIYAAGTFTKYARRYYANEFHHKYYNSREVGQKLAEIIRGKIDPSKDETKEKSDLVPQLLSPIFLYCQLPGDFNLFILRKPGKELDLETAYNLCDYGEVLTTGDCKMKNGLGYFRLHLNPEGFVESITCYTKDKIDYVNLSSLYGLHETILNNLLMRYDTCVISDLFEYFRQPWALALYHNHFQRVRDENYKAFFQTIFEDSNFYDRLIEELELSNWKSLDDSVRQRLESDYLNSKIQDDVKSNLLQFLEHYKEDLPVYATFSAVKKFFNKRPRHGRLGGF